MVAYLIRAEDRAVRNERIRRAFRRAGVCSLGTLVCAYLLARRFFSPLAGFLTVVLLGATPLMAVGSLIATYDPLLVVLLGAGAGVSGTRLFCPDGARTATRLVAAGVATGLGFLSKHTMLLLVPCLVLFLSVSPAHRFWLHRPNLIGLCFCYAAVRWGLHLERAPPLVDVRASAVFDRQKPIATAASFRGVSRLTGALIGARPVRGVRGDDVALPTWSFQLLAKCPAGNRPHGRKN